jgi:hypothetical protein
MFALFIKYIDIRNLVERNASIEQMLRNNPSVWPIKHPRSDEIYFSGKLFS